MAEAAVMGFQSQEYAKASVMYSDLELACQMQLNEALAASAAMSGVVTTEPRREQRRTSNVKGMGEAGGGEGDKSIAFAVQSAELRRRQQELIDQEKAVQVGRDDVAVEIQRRWHDKQFARSISEMPEEEWEDVGDQFERPFVVRVAEEAVEMWDVDHVCNLYFGKMREDPGYVGMAWALTDAEGHVLFQQTKFLGLGVSAYVADYTALINGLAYARSAGVRTILARGDSVLVANQVGGKWRARSPAQVKFLEQVKEHQNELHSLTVYCVPKSKNKYVMSLARQAIQVHVEKLIKTGQPIPAQPEEEDITQDCPICFESTRVAEMFLVRGCSHEFCRTCLSQHVEVQVKENLVPVRCPLECSNHLELDQCEPHLPPKLLESFAKCLTEASIPEADRVYCPFRNCSALMSKGGLNVAAGSSSGHPHTSSIGRCECMECHRLFCVECQVPWHAGVSCAEYQQLPPHERDAEDIKLHQLARNQNWQRCKKCKHLIELNTGCYHMTCKCGYEFCYTCGAPWKNKQATCKCKLWDENNIILDDDDEELDSGDDASEYESDEGDYDFEPEPVDMFYKTRLCRHWARGHCWNGEACRFAHGEAQLRRGREEFVF